MKLCRSQSVTRRLHWPAPTRDVDRLALPTPLLPHKRFARLGIFHAGIHAVEHCFRDDRLVRLLADAAHLCCVDSRK